MPLEACMIIMDNSEYMRNGDLPPTRFQAQKDAISVLFNAKTGSNPESSAGVMSMGGESPQVLATLTQDFGKILSSLSKSHISGISDLLTALSVAQLALKHRENKNQRQRIVVFCGSPVLDGVGSSGGVGGSKGKGKVTEEEMIKLGKKMKKNNVAVDVVLFGEEGLACEEVMSKFVEAVNAENSHLVSIPAGPHLLSDLLVSSPILAGEGGAGGGGNANGMAVDEEGFPIDVPGGGGAGGGGGGGGGNDEYGGIDPNMDPELAMVIRMSIQEEEDRQRRLAAESNPTAGSSSGSTVSATATDDVAMEDVGQHPVSAPISNTGKDVGAPEVPALGSGSSEVAIGGSTAAPGGEVTGMAVDGEDDEEEDEDEEEAMLRAIAMSMEDQGGASNEKKE